MTALQPSPDQIAAFLKADMDEPVCMVNLLKFRAEAAYDAGTPEAAEGLTGQAAYARYGAGVSKVFKKIGAKPVYFAPVQRFMIGTGDWDAVALAWYPSRRVFLEMPQRDDYRAIHYHRDAGLLHQDLIETTPGAI
ncbi:hypothetical protein [Hyphomonas johnsonii]|uniref:DUF1330 domain-containing protein n=1 Tax=Hyphomonas johnsonii MHS-2 TaxID=1280950 RepID=A0A059FVI4_9PROT|nr:hypothetical protein [Hyphomonas johnsonii]KCZ94458.1 hypothetical protein HJO_03750 [Hyphomonas johnsonii MHS-2]